MKVLNDGSGEKLIFIDGPGGCGKTYLFNTLIRYLIKNDVKVLTTAWTGIAANLLLGGKTIHSTFNLPLNLTEQSVCNIDPNSPHGKYLKSVEIILFDEITMASKYALEATDRFFRTYVKRIYHMVGRSYWYQAISGKHFQ